MTVKDIAVKKYVVRLSAQEREQLQALVRKGKGPPRRLLKARILLKADTGKCDELGLLLAARGRASTRKQLVEVGSRRC